MSISNANSIFRGTTKIGEALLNDQIQANLKMWLDWGFLYIGGFTNVSRNDSDAYGGSPATLRLVDDPNYTLGQVWASNRKDWVWESGVGGIVEPITVSGTWVNGSFKSFSASGYTHYVNFPEGRVIFDTPLGVSDTVECNYSYRYCQVSNYDNDNIQFLHFNSLNSANQQFTQTYGSGNWDIPAVERIQLPAIGIQPIDNRDFAGFELGGTHYIHQDVIFHVFTETSHDVNKIVDILGYQPNKALYFFDCNAVAANSGFPIDYRGMRIDGAKMFPQLNAATAEGGYRWKLVRFTDLTVDDKHRAHQNLYYGVVTAELEFIFNFGV